MKAINPFCLSIFMLLTSLTAISQNAFTLRAGVNRANVSVNTEFGEFSPDPILGIQAAFGLDIGLSSGLSIWPEFSFVQKGFKINFGEEGSGKVVINYLELPVVLKYGWGTEQVAFHVLSGPSLSYAATGKTTSTEINPFTGEETKETEDIDFEEDGFNRADFGFYFGGGVGLPLASGSIFLDVRYFLGLASINEDAEDDEKIQNRSWGFTLGYRIPLGTKTISE